MIRGRGFDVFIIITCSYELAAIFSRGHIPTISTLDKQAHHFVAPFLLGMLAAHFFWPEKVIIIKTR